MKKLFCAICDGYVWVEVFDMMGEIFIVEEKYFKIKDNKIYCKNCFENGVETTQKIIEKYGVEVDE